MRAKVSRYGWCKASGIWRGTIIDLKKLENTVHDLSVVVNQQGIMSAHKVDDAWPATK